MTENKSQLPLKSAAALRQQRLAQALRDNLRRRKQQQTTVDTAVEAGKTGAVGRCDPPDRADAE